MNGPRATGVLKVLERGIAAGVGRHRGRADQVLALAVAGGVGRRVGEELERVGGARRRC